MAPAKRGDEEHRPNRPARHDLWILVGVFAFALVVRLVYLWQSSSGPTFDTPVSDAQNYNLMARSALEKGELTYQFFWQAFFYPFFLTFVYLLSNSSILVVKILQVLLGSATCTLTYLLGKRIFDRRIGLAGAAITALYGPLVYFETELLATGWATFWSVALILLLLIVRSRGNLAHSLALGICAALAVLTRPTFLPFFLAACAWLAIALYRDRPNQRSPIPALLLIVIGFCAVATPAAWLNFRVTGHFGIMPANGGVNLYMGNNPDATETEATRPWLEYERLRTLATDEGATDQWSEQRLFQRKVVDYALTQPLDFAAGMVRKSIQFLSSREIPSYEDVYLFRRWSGLLSLLTWKVGRFGFPFGVLLPLTIVGLAFHWRRISIPVALWLLLYPLSIILVHVTGRYRIPLVPVMALVAAAGCVTLYDMIRHSQWRRPLVAAVFASALALLCSLSGPFRMETLNFEADVYYSIGEHNRKLLGQRDEAVRYYRKALQLNPDLPEAHTSLGHELLARGESTEAIRHFNEVLRVEPDFPGAHNNLVVALVKTGQTEAAIAHCHEWLATDPESVDAHGTMGLVMSTAGRIDEAVHYWRATVQLKPGDAQSRYDLASALRAQGNLDEAVTHFQESLRLDPTHADRHSDLGIALSRLGRTDEAIRAYREAIRIDPGYFGAPYNLGNLLARQGRTEEAIGAYRSAIRINPTYANAHYNLALVLQESGRPDQAIESLRETLSLDPNHTRARQELAAILRERGG